MKRIHEKTKHPYQSVFITMVFLQICFNLCFAFLLFRHCMQQTINAIGTFSKQTVPFNMNESINRIISGSSSGAYQAGLTAMRQAGYQDTYLTLFFHQWFFYAVFFIFLFFLLAAVCFSIFVRRRNSYDREIQRILEWACETSPDPVITPSCKYIPFSIVRSIHSLKNQVKRQSVLHEEDTARIMHYMENISHQLKTPLALITAVCERLSMHHPDMEEKMSACIAQTEKMSMLIRDFLQLGKFDCNKQKMHFEYTSAENLLESVANNLELMAQNKNLSFSICGQKNILWYCDVFWMEEIIGNILKNCIEHSENGLLSVFFEQKNNRNEIIIKDCGIGLKMGYEKKIFERYSSADRTSVEGSGLGLSVAKQAIRLHFGAITAENHANGGVEFKISFPQLDSETIYPAFSGADKIS